MLRHDPSSPWRPEIKFLMNDHDRLTRLEERYAHLQRHQAEQDTTEVEGTVFTPNASFEMEARPGGASLDLPLQIVAGRVRLVGLGDVTLPPAPGRATGRLSRQVRLIR